MSCFRVQIGVETKVKCAGNTPGDGTSSSMGWTSSSDIKKVAFLPISNVTDVSVDDYSACVVGGSEGRVYCWNAYGEDGSVGDGNFNSSLIPVQLALKAKKVTMGDTHVCAIGQDSSLWCWGANDYGKCGTGSVGGKLGVPTQVNLGPGNTAVDLGVSNDFTCVIVAPSYGVRCFGSNTRYQLGFNASTSNYPDPANNPFVDLGVGRTAVQLQVASGRSCVVDDLGDVKCWVSVEGGRRAMDRSTNCVDEIILATKIIQKNDNKIPGLVLCVLR